MKMAVIGVGHLGKHHARILSEMDDVELVAIVDVDPERGRELADSFGCQSLTDYRELTEVDAVTVAVPTRYHFVVASHFLERRCPILVEKPMTSTLEEARKLRDLAQATGTLLQVGHIERFNPVFDAIRDMEIAPRFVEAHRLAPFSFRSTDIGVVMDLMIHDIDILLEMTGSPVKRVDAVGGALLSDQEDLANVRIEFESGCVANLTASRVSLKKMRRLRVFATDSFISLDFDQKYGFVAKKAPDFNERREKISDLDPATLGPRAAALFKDFIQMRELQLDPDEPLKLEIASFIDAVKSGREPVVSSDHGLRAMELAFQIQEAIRERGW